MGATEGDEEYCNILFKITTKIAGALAFVVVNRYPGRAEAEQ